jgi:hypothetical protein
MKFPRTFIFPLPNFAFLLLVSLITSCGGGGSSGSGGGSVTTPSVTAPSSDIVISEVSTCFYTNIDCWFEIYNRSSGAINLGNYSIKSTSVSVLGGTLAPSTFSLPSFNIPASSYVVISGNPNNLVQRGTQKIFLRTGNVVPFWGANGFVEILLNGATSDFVSFGTSTQTPVTANYWSGQPVTALPFSAQGYGKSIVRPWPLTSNTNTRTATDWIRVDWATPGGKNDVPAGAVDTDGDGIPDSAEVLGGTFGGIDLYAMGARTSQKDIFIEIDGMNSLDPGVIPRSESLQMVVDSFSAQGIAIHFDAGTKFSGAFSTLNFNLGQGDSVVDYEPCVTMNQTTCTSNTSNKRSIYDWKDENMDLRRRSVFHYLLFGNSQLANGNAGSSGLAELVGNDLIVTLGNWGLTTNIGTSLNRLINYQASTIMHELGHNLGLEHGGNEETNYKPNYWSVMNYMYQLNGLDPDPTSSTAYQRWRLARGDSTPLVCALVGSPCGDKAQFVMSYSNGSSGALDETNLFEANNVGRGSTGGAYADWNMSGALNAGALSIDLNADGNPSVIRDYNDWGNLILPFTRQAFGNAGVSRMLNSTRILNPISADRQDVAPETAPSEEFFNELRR